MGVTSWPQIIVDENYWIKVQKIIILAYILNIVFCMYVVLMCLMYPEDTFLSFWQPLMCKPARQWQMY